MNQGVPEGRLTGLQDFQPSLPGRQRFLSELAATVSGILQEIQQVLMQAAICERRMSTIKDPEGKKRLSLERERRNRYGENSKSSRKNIARGKQRRHMDERRTVGEVLGRIKGQIQDDHAIEAEFLVKTRIIDSRRRGFKKTPDVPLGLVLQKKKAKKTSK